MRKILDIRSRLARESSLDQLKALKQEAENHKLDCHFHSEKETVEDLIDDIEIKIDTVKSELKDAKKNAEIINSEGFIEIRPRLVESIIPSVNCTLYLEKGCTLREIERESIRVILTRNKDNRTVTARELGISVRTLRNKLNEYLDKGEVAVYELSRIR